LCILSQHTSSEHRIQQQYPSVRNVLGQLVVEQPRLRCLLVPLNQDLAYPYTPAALAECLFHGLASAHDRHTTDLALELDAIVGPTDGRCNHVLLHGQVVETFLYKQTNNAVGVEDKVGSVCVLVADDTVSRRRKSVSGRVYSSGWKTSKRTYVRREINWGVCGRMCTFS
jgi:hypothetical protein